MEVVMDVVMTAVPAMVVWQREDDVVVRWWGERVGSSGGCGVACRLGWPEFWGGRKGEGGGGGMAADPQWLSWCSNGCDEVRDDEGGKGSSDVAVMKIKVAVVGVGQPREAAMEVVMAVVMTAVLVMVVWQREDDVVVRWWGERVGSSGGCGVACWLGWPEFWGGRRCVCWLGFL
nr:hypothetical protein [Tanacetum cinerariifolium]